jgi:ribonuclease G
MQAAFVDIGLERAAFLHASDIVPNPCNGEVRSDNVTELVAEGCQLVVQVVKDPLGSKGARLTTHISIPSRFLVFLPAMSTAGISQKIEDDGERKRLREILSRFVEEDDAPGGYIARTAAEAAGAEALRADMKFLARLWESIQARAAEARPRELIHQDLPLALRALRDLVGPEVKRCGSIPTKPGSDPLSSSRSSSPTAKSGSSITPARGPSSTSIASRTRSRRRWSARFS